MPGGPDLPGVVAALRARDVRHLVIGGFAVIAHQYVRATEDVDVLVPDDPANDRLLSLALADLGARLPSDTLPTVEQLGERAHTRLESPEHGAIDILREGEPPLDFATVDDGAIDGTVGGVTVRVAGLESLVAFKRLAGRPRDRLDLEELAARLGELPIIEVPGLDPPG